MKSCENQITPLEIQGKMREIQLRQVQACFMGIDGNYLYNGLKICIGICCTEQAISAWQGMKLNSRVKS